MWLLDILHPQGRPVANPGLWDATPLGLWGITTVAFAMIGELIVVTGRGGRLYALHAYPVRAIP